MRRLNPISIKSHNPTSADHAPPQTPHMTQEKEEVTAMPKKEPEASENKRIPIPERIKPEPKKRGFLSRFFLPNVQGDYSTKLIKTVKRWLKNRRGT